jgi:hypothetical protein
MPVDRYIEGLNECTDPVAGDQMWIMDASAPATDKDRRVDVAKFALLAGATFAGGVMAPNFRSHNLTLLVNSAVSISVPSAGLLIFVCPLILKSGGAIGYYSPATGSASAEIYAQAASGSLLAVTPNTVLGNETTTGVDGKVNVNPVIGGVIWIKNRTASPASMQVFVIA